MFGWPPKHPIISGSCNIRLGSLESIPFRHCKGDLVIYTKSNLTVPRNLRTISCEQLVIMAIRSLVQICSGKSWQSFPLRFLPSEHILGQNLLILLHFHGSRAGTSHATSYSSMEWWNQPRPRSCAEDFYCHMMPLTGTSVHGAKTPISSQSTPKALGNEPLSMWHLIHMGSHQVWAVFVTESSRKHDEISGLGLRITQRESQWTHFSFTTPANLWQLPSKPEITKRSLFMQKPSCTRLGVSTRAFDSALRVLTASCGVSCCLIWIISCKNVHVALMQLGLCHGYWILRQWTRWLGCSRFTARAASNYSQASAIRIKCNQKQLQYSLLLSTISACSGTNGTHFLSPLIHR